MPRPIWKGAITFGLVNVPVAMMSATRSHDIRMHLVHDEDGARLRQQRVCSRDGEVVPWDHVARGFERDDGRFVRITDEELESIAAERSRAMAIEDVVPLEQIDPIYVERTWYLVPSEGGERGYALLVSALEGSDRAAVARVTMRGRQQLVSIRSTGEVLLVESLRYADEVKSVDEVFGGEGEEAVAAKASKKEVTMARAFLESLEVDFDPARYADEYRDQLAALIERKSKEGDVVEQPEHEVAPERTPADDIIAALEASLAAQRDGGSKPKAKAARSGARSKSRSR